MIGSKGKSQEPLLVEGTVRDGSAQIEGRSLNHAVHDPVDNPVLLNCESGVRVQRVLDVGNRLKVARRVQLDANRPLRKYGRRSRRYSQRGEKPRASLANPPLAKPDFSLIRT